MGEIWPPNTLIFIVGTPRREPNLRNTLMALAALNEGIKMGTPNREPQECRRNRIGT